jgi:hypothetical protein
MNQGAASAILSLLALARPWTTAPGAGDDVLARSRATYAALHSYADSGSLEYVYGPAGASIREEQAFRTYYRAPRSFYFDFIKAGHTDRFVVWSDADAFHTWWQTTGVEQTYGKGQGSAAFLMGDAPTQHSLTLIAPLLFAQAGLTGTLTEFGDVSIAGTEDVAGRACHKLAGVARSGYQSTGRVVNVRATTVWIDVQTLLVRKVFEDTPEGGPAGYVMQLTTAFEPRANPTLDDAVFRFIPPKRH